ncbi:MAG: flagellin [Phycisphaerales bacterium]|jgi:flagellin|nr:flagellin [Phycisphaerales bacterium]
MARINTNVSSVIAQANLSRNNKDLDIRLTRLATGVRINRGADDPAGLIVSERLRTDIQGVSQGIKNAERASLVIATTEGSLAEVNDLLNSIKSLVVEAANTGAFSDTERQANQLQIDSAIDSLTRISNTATFGGLKLLDGSLDYVVSGLVSSAISKANVFGASFVGTDEIDVEVDVVQSAQKGSLFVRGDLPTPGAPENGTFLSQTTLRIMGPKGVTELIIAAGTSYNDAINIVNQRSPFTGVEAALINGDATSGLVFRSTDYGSDSFVRVERIDKPSPPLSDGFAAYAFDGNAAYPDTTGGFPWSLIGTTLTTATRDAGQDVGALINGALATGRGLLISSNGQELSLELLLNEDFAIRPDAADKMFYITGGGALFQIGPQVQPQQQTNIGVQSVAASLLGGTLVEGQLQYLSSLKSGQSNDLKTAESRNDFTPLQDILDKSIDEISVLRGRLGAFERNVIETGVRSLQSQYENLSSSVSQIRDADFAAETSALTRAQVLTSTATSVLQLANTQAQQVLQLLG